MSRMSRWVCSLLLAGCAMAPGDDLAVSEAAIVNGTLETGRPEVVFLYNLRGAACTGSIISPYVVLTANHCIEVSDGVAGDPSTFRVYIGSSTRQLTGEYLVADVRQVQNPGIGRNPNDVALVVLATPATEPPMQLYRGDPAGLTNATVTAVGYGQTPSGGSGTKYTTTTRVRGYQDGYLFVEPSVCQGDSGGPMILNDGTIAGVVSFGFSPDGMTSPQCGTAIGAYNEIYRHLPFIDSVLEETGTCVPADRELCNGEDDNCDGVVDEGCIAMGDPCTSSDECVGGLCADTTIGRVCTSACDPLRPAEGCSLGSYCSVSGCEGYCVPGEAGAVGFGEACTVDTDCHSLYCRDPGDGMQRCLEPCRHDAGACLGGEVCAALAGGCGSCVDQAIFAGRGLGEPCDTDAECGEARACRDVAGIRECVSLCDAGGGCPERFTCRDAVCIRDRTQGVGGVCEVSADCGGGICAALGDRNWCTITCTSADECATGFDCMPAGSVSVCAPVTALDGESCTVNTDCASGVCAGTSTGSFCTRGCDADTACAPGFECQRIGGASTQAVCVRPEVEARDGGGCAVRPGRSLGGLGFGLLGLLALGFALRRRG